MTTCCDMKLNEVYVCKSCGLELTVSKECKPQHPEKSCCHPTESECHISCCGKDLTKK